MGDFTSPRQNVDFTSQGFSKAPNGVQPTFFPSSTPDIGIVVAPVAANFDTVANPLRVGSVPLGLLLFVKNEQLSSIRVVGPKLADPGVVADASSMVLVASDGNGGLMGFSPNGQVLPAVIYPHGTGADDAPTLQTALIDNAYVRQTIMSATTINGILADWVFKTNTNLQSGTSLLMEPGVVCDVQMTSGTFSDFFLLGFIGLTVLGSFSADATLYSNIVSLSAAPAVGSTIHFRGTPANGTTFLAQQYDVLAVSAGPPFSVTLDRPVLFPFKSGDVVSTVTGSVQDITINGQWAIIQGRADRAIEVTGARRLRIQQLQFRPNALGQNFICPLSIDIGSLDVDALDVIVNAAGSGFAGGTLESTERGTFTRYVVEGNTGGGNGIVCYDDANCALVECAGENNGGAGCLVTSNGMTIGCLDFRVDGGEYAGNGNLGLGVERGTSVTLEAVSASGNATSGIDADNTTILNIVGCDTDNNGRYGTRISATCSRVRLTSHASTGDGTNGAFGDRSGVALFGPADMEDFTIKNYALFGLFLDAGIASTFVMHFTGGRFESVTSGSRGCQMNSPARCVFDDTRFDLSEAAGNAQWVIIQNDGVVMLRDIVATQGSANKIGYQGAAGVTLRIEGRVDFDTLTTPFIINAAGFVSKPVSGKNQVGPLGGAPIAVAWPDLKSCDDVVLKYIALAGAPAAYSVARTPGVGFTVTPTAGDASTLEFSVV